MPVEIHGVYWTIQEIASTTGWEYSGISRRVSKQPGVVSLGKTLLIPDEVVQGLKIGPKDTLTLATAAIRLKMAASTLKQIVDAGFPTAIDENGKRAILKEHIDIIQRAYLHVLKRSISKRDRYKAIADEAVKLLERQNAKND